jgi:hypothetical protein
MVFSATFSNPLLSTSFNTLQNLEHKHLIINLSVLSSFDEDRSSIYFDEIVERT